MKIGKTAKPTFARRHEGTFLCRGNVSMGQEMKEIMRLGASSPLSIIVTETGRRIFVRKHILFFCLPLCRK